MQKSRDFISRGFLMRIPGPCHTLRETLSIRADERRSRSGGRRCKGRSAVCAAGEASAGRIRWGCGCPFCCCTSGTNRPRFPNSFRRRDSAGRRDRASNFRASRNTRRCSRRAPTRFCARFSVPASDGELLNEGATPTERDARLRHFASFDR